MVQLSINSAVVGFLAASTLVSGFALPTPQDFELEWEANPLAKRASKLPVVALTDGVKSTGERPARPELNKMTADRLALFVQALAQLQAMSYNQPHSYYQIAGIHGRPYKGWNGQSNTGNANSGYCTHASTLFPTWHRPYLAMYEKALHDTAANIVKLYADQARWTAALNGWRMPYWDWASNNAQMPSVLTSATISVLTPTGQKTIANPLFSTKFTTLSRTDFPDSPFYTWSQTLRYPTTQSANAVPQDDKVNQQLGSSASSLTQRVYQLYVNRVYSSYAAVSNKGSNVNAPDSLEAIHDTIHGLTGNGGHMSYIDYSSFDPIFFLHHTNVDRLFALWQGVYPNSWVSNQVNPFGTYGIKPGTVETATTPLVPFYQGSGSWHTSNSVRSTATFGYTYPELSDWKYAGNPSGYSTAVQKQIVKLYGATNAQVAASTKRKRANTPPLVVKNQYNDYKVDIHTNKFVLGGSYFVHIFLGTPNTDAADWSISNKLVGDYVVFANKMDVPPAADTVCGVQINMVSGSIPLTQALIDNIDGVESLSPANVTAYLKNNLTWKVSLMNDNAVDVTDVCDLAVSVSGAVVTLPGPGEVFPTYGEYTTYLNVTESKVTGGLPGNTTTVEDAPPTVLLI